MLTKLSLGLVLLAALAAGTVGLSSSSTSTAPVEKPRCCSKDCCKDCPDCTCEGECCGQCEDDCQCPNKS